MCCYQCQPAVCLAVKWLVMKFYHLISLSYYYGHTRSHTTTHSCTNWHLALLILFAYLPVHVCAELSLVRNLCDKTVPGNKVTVTGIYAIKKGVKPKDKGGPRVNIGKFLLSTSLHYFMYLSRLPASHLPMSCLPMSRPPVISTYVTSACHVSLCYVCSYRVCLCHACLCYVSLCYVYSCHVCLCYVCSCRIC